jgi:inosine-uridine nucleoside N-ribohydrolase
VFGSGLDVTMIGLDVTHRAMLSAARAEALRGSGRAGAFVADLHAFYRRFHLEVYGHDDTPVHDAVAVAHVIRPDLLKMEHVPVEVDVTQGPCRGRTVVDQLRRTGQEPNAHVAHDVDADGFIDLLTDRIGSLA